MTELNPTGSGLIYSTYLGGSGYEIGYGIAVDTSGNAYVTGITDSSDFPTTAGAFQTTFGGFADAFVTELNPTGSGLVYSTYLGGSDYEVGFGIAVDTSGNAYVTGFTDSSDFPTTAGAFQTTYGGFSDAFVTELNPTGSGLVYSTYLGGSDDERASASRWTPPATPTLRDTRIRATFPRPLGPSRRPCGFDDAFVTEFNPTGTGLVYSTYLGGSDYDYGSGIAVNTSGNAYVAGETFSSDFPTTAGAFQTTLGGTWMPL